MFWIHLFTVWIFSAPSPGAPDLCPGTMAGGVFPGSYGTQVTFADSLTLRDAHGEFRAQIFLNGNLTVTAGIAGVVTGADFKPVLSVVYLGNKPVNFAAESLRGDCSLDKASSETHFTLACGFTPGSGVVREGTAAQKATLTFSVGHILCGRLQGNLSFSIVQAKIDEWARLGMQVTKRQTAGTFILEQTAGAFIDARIAQDAISDRLEVLLDPTYRPPISDTLVRQVGVIARELDVALRKQADPRVRHCLQVHHRNRVNRFVRERSRASVVALFRESHESVAFSRGGQGVNDLLRWLNLLTVAGVETCSEETQRDLVAAIRKKLEVVVEYSLMPGVPAVEVLSVLDRVPVVGAVSWALVRQVPTQVRAFGEARIRDEVKKLQAFRKPADLCDRKVAAAWVRAEAVESLVNRLTAARFRNVSGHRKKVSPRKNGCK